MADVELPYEHQLDEIATRVNKYRADDIQPESYLMPTFLKYFPVVMELGVLPGVKWNNISGLFIRSPVLPMTYVDRDMLLAMSKQHVWDAATPEGYHPRHSLAIVKLFPANPVYALTTIYVPSVQGRLHFLPALTNLHNLQMEAVALVYMPKNCMYMPEPSSGDHYTLLPLTGGKDISIGVLSAFAAAKLTVTSKHGSGDMGVHLKLPAHFGPQPDSDDLITETALCHGPIWKNAEFVIRDDNNHPVLVNGEPVVMESPIKVATSTSTHC